MRNEIHSKEFQEYEEAEQYYEELLNLEEEKEKEKNKEKTIPFFEKMEKTKDLLNSLIQTITEFKTDFDEFRETICNNLNLPFVLYNFESTIKSCRLDKNGNQQELVRILNDFKLLMDKADT